MQRSYSILLFLFWVMITSLPTFAQVDYTIYSTANGLAQNDVVAIYQDKQYYTWLLTYEGLHRYDGQDFKIYKMSPQYPALKSNLFFQITEDNNNRLWLQTLRGLVILDKQKDNFLSVSETLKSHPLFNEDIVTAIKFDDPDNIWVGTQQGLYHLKTSKDTVVKHITFYDCPFIRSMYLDSKDSLWLSTLDGIYLFSKNIFVKKSNYSGLSIVKQGRYLYIGGDGTFEMDIQTGQIRTITPHKTMCLAKAEDEMLIGTIHGAFRYHEKKGLQPFLPKEEGIVQTIYVDRYEKYWISVKHSGVMLYDFHAKPFYPLQFTNPKFNIRLRGIFEDSRQNLWLGYKGKGIACLPRNQQEPAQVVLPENNSETGYFFDELDGHIYVASVGVIDLVKSGNTWKVAQHINVPGTVMTLYADSLQKSLWVGTYSNGLWHYNITTRQLQQLTLIPHSAQPLTVRTITPDGHGNLWIGTDHGLTILNIQDRKQQVYQFHWYKEGKDSSTLSYSSILPIFHTRSGETYIGTMGGGLNKVLKDVQGFPTGFRRVQLFNKLPSTTIKSIREDCNGYLWISTGTILCRYNPVTQTTQHYTSEDGLQHGEFGDMTSCYRKDGTMIFGGTHGINRFYPEKITIDSTPPQIVFTSFRLFDNPVSSADTVNGRIILENDIAYTSNIVLKSDENSFTFGFTALSRTAVAKIRYAYKLSGLDKEWIETDAKNKWAKYTSVPYGTYTLEIKACNPDGVWITNVKSINITILKPFWLTYWAFVIYALMGAGVLFLTIYYIRLRQKAKLEKRYARKDRERLRQLVNMQTQFFTNLSHELRTPLTLIVTPIAQLLKHKPQYTEEQIKLFEKIDYNAKLLLRITTQLLDYAKYRRNQLVAQPISKDIVRFTQNIIHQFEAWLNQKQIELKFQASISPIALTLDYEMLEHIYYNLLSNAIKYTPKGGNIIVNINKQTESVIISVLDTGCGIPDEMQDKIFQQFFQAEKHNASGGTGLGLAFTKNLVQLNGGKIDFISKENMGTTFRITFPLDELPKETTENIIDTPKPERVMLIADDNDDIRELLSIHFHSNFQIVEASHGLEALTMAKEHFPDVMLLDIMMPQMDGMEVCKALKNDIAISHIPVIMLTAKNSTESKSEGYRHGADIYCTKPFDMEELDAMVYGLINNRERLKKVFHAEPEKSLSDIPYSTIDSEFLEKCTGIINANIAEEHFTVEDLAEKLNLTKYLLNKKLRALVGETAVSFIRVVRLKAAAKMMMTENMTITQAAFNCGFYDHKYFRECFKEYFGITPSEYLRKS